MVVNEVFNKVNACLLPKSETDASSEKRRAFIKKHRGMVWNITDIIYDFLQVLLINYFAQRNLGIFTHAIGLRDVNGQGFLFAGKSGAGNSTMARLWHKHSKAMVLNDDRVIIRKINRDFFIYGSPLHGEFSDYLASRIESVKLTNLFFIHHSPKNKLRPVFQNEAFKLLYPAVFPTFWDRRCLGNIVYFCQNLVKEISCSKLGFVNNSEIIKFVRCHF